MVVLLVLLGIKKGIFSSNEKEAEATKTETEKIEQETQQEVQQTEQMEEEQTEALAEETELPEQEAETTLIFVGDVCFAYEFQNSYTAKGISGILSDEMLTEMREADITMLNQEFPFSNRGTPAPDKKYTFRIHPDNVKALKEMGADIVTLANNHSLDYGEEALEDTFTTLDQAELPYVGAGDSFERASRCQTFDVNGKKFGYLAASRVIPVSSWNIENHQPGLFCTYDDTLLLEAIKKAKQDCDFLTVYVHWGVERSATPEAYQVTMAEEYIEAGADLVIGSHTHCLQGIEFFDGKPVFYGLGNFIFHKTMEQTAAIKVVVGQDGTASYKVIPARTTDGQTYILEGEEAKNLYQYMEGISFGVKIDEEGYVLEETKSET